MKITGLTVGLCLMTGMAGADVRLEFLEGAPKDRFVLTNVAGCDLSAMDVTIDMSQSAGGLIFDVSGQGAGVEVFQPFKVVSGAQFLDQTPKVVDGQRDVTFKINGLTAGSQIVVTTDLDDTIGAREITVRGSEFAGTVMSVVLGDETGQALFADKPDATANIGACS